MSGRDWVVSGSGRVGVGWGRGRSVGRSGRSGYDFCSLVQSKMVVVMRNGEGCGAGTRCNVNGGGNGEHAVW